MKLKYYFISVFLFIVLLLSGCVTNDGQSGILSTPDESGYLQIGDYRFKIPDWWNSVRVSVPKGLTSEKDIGNYVFKYCGADTGTKTTWREALKIWAVESKRLGIFPVYIAHCYKAGEEFLKAAKVYSDLYDLSDSRGEYKDWYKVYLSYNAGESYSAAGDYANAKVWYTKSTKYVGNKDSAIDYYAKQSKKLLEGIK
jgi:hypothetical protein